MSEEVTNYTPEDDEAGKKKKSIRSKKLTMAGTSTDLATYVRDQAVWHKLFLENLADFTAFDATFDNAYATGWRSTIDELTAHTNDNVMLQDIAQKTQDILEKYKATGQLADTLEFFVRKAFPDDERKPDEFGFRLLNSANNNTSLKFTLYAHTMLRIALHYQTDLTTAGLPAAWFTDFEAAAGECGDLEIEQEVAKRMRIKATTQRIKLANQLHGFSSAVSKAAKIIYRHQPETAKIWERG